MLVLVAEFPLEITFVFNYGIFRESSFVASLSLV